MGLHFPSPLALVYEAIYFSFLAGQLTHSQWQMCWNKDLIWLCSTQGANSFIMKNEVWTHTKEISCYLVSQNSSRYCILQSPDLSKQQKYDNLWIYLSAFEIECDLGTCWAHTNAILKTVIKGWCRLVNNFPFLPWHEVRDCVPCVQLK